MSSTSSVTFANLFAQVRARFRRSASNGGGYSSPPPDTALTCADTLTWVPRQHISSTSTVTTTLRSVTSDASSVTTSPVCATSDGRQDGYLPIMGAIRRALRRLVYGPPADAEHRCMAHLWDGRCRVVVPPGEGVRRAGLVFCCEEHAVGDQEDQLG